MRVLLKMSWEALWWEKEMWFDWKFITEIAKEIKELKDNWIQIWIVLWGWNIFRWAQVWDNIDRSLADYVWMLATVMNWVYLHSALKNIWIESVIMSAIDIPQIWEKFIKRNWVKYLEEWKVVICVWWTWNPYFTTDSAWVLRALELECDIMIKATKVDWVYDKDPKKFSDAVLIKDASYDEVLAKNLKVMDQSWIALARDWNLVLKVVNMYKKWSIVKSCKWENEWTTIK